MTPCAGGRVTKYTIEQGKQTQMISVSSKTIKIEPYTNCLDLVIKCIIKATHNSNGQKLSRPLQTIVQRKATEAPKTTQEGLESGIQSLNTHIWRRQLTGARV